MLPGDCKFLNYFCVNVYYSKKRKKKKKKKGVAGQTQWVQTRHPFFVCNFLDFKDEDLQGY